MKIIKYFTYRMLVSERTSFRKMLDNGKFLRDRNDVYLIDIYSAYEDCVAMAFRLEFNLSEINCDPDFDW